MSGRSAYVRAKNIQQADKRAIKDYSEYEEDPYLYGYTGAPMPMPRPVISTNPSYVSQHLRRRSASSAGSTYGYPAAPHLHKPRPIVIASAIEKSDFRTHLDGMSTSLRGKLGGLMKSKKDPPPVKNLRRPGLSSYNSDFGTPSADLTTPSIDAVPSLSSSTTRSDGQTTSSSGHSHAIPTRQRQPQDSVAHKIRRFEGGGKLPQLGWKSLSNVSHRWRAFGKRLLTVHRTLNCGTKMETRLYICSCVGPGPSRRLRLGSILR